MLNTQAREEIKQTIRHYLGAFPRVGDDAVTRFLMFPYCYWTAGRLVACPDPKSFLQFRDDYMANVGADVVSSEVIEISAEAIGTDGAFANLRSVRMTRNGAKSKEVNTGFVLHHTGHAWLMMASVQGT
jgi:hypothetical protein